jgi:hypothetical protein
MRRIIPPGERNKPPVRLRFGARSAFRKWTDDKRTTLTDRLTHKYDRPSPHRNKDFKSIAKLTLEYIRHYRLEMLRPPRHKSSAKMEEEGKRDVLRPAEIKNIISIVNAGKVGRRLTVSLRGNEHRELPNSLQADYEFAKKIANANGLKFNHHARRTIYGVESPRKPDAMYSSLMAGVTFH